jgi:nitroreductase/dihydropteridine reductase
MFGIELEPSAWVAIVCVLVVIAIEGFSFYTKQQGGEEKAPVAPPAQIPCASFLSNLEKRRAVKHFSPGPVELKHIRRAIENAPSSFGLQPYKIVVVTNQEKKAALRAVSFNQAQVEECHALFVFCALNDVEKRMEEFITATGSEGIRAMMKGFLDATPDKVAWAKRQAYIALGFGLAAAAETEVASCPMEGFIPDKVSEILGLDANLSPCVFLAVGQPAGDEETPRFRFDDLVLEIA